MAFNSRIHSPLVARGLLSASPPRILPIERAPRRFAPGVRAVSGVPGPSGSTVSRRPLAPADAAAVAPPSAPSAASSAIHFLTLCHRLKTTKRKGWINHSIKGPESISDHMYRMALMALIAGDLPGVSKLQSCMTLLKLLLVTLLHRMVFPRLKKSRREQAALDEMCQVLGGRPIAAEIKELWEEYENNSSIEANLVKDFDKVEMILQALECEKNLRNMAKC